MDIRKISIGPDYKNNAMHYIVGQKVLDSTHEIHLIQFKEESRELFIYIINDNKEVILWKWFTSAMPIAVECNINF